MLENRCECRGTSIESEIFIWKLPHITIIYLSLLVYIFILFLEFYILILKQEINNRKTIILLSMVVLLIIAGLMFHNGYFYTKKKCYWTIHTPDLLRLYFPISNTQVFE